MAGSILLAIEKFPYLFIYSCFLFLYFFVMAAVGRSCRAVWYVHCALCARVYPLNMESGMHPVVTIRNLLSVRCVHSADRCIDRYLLESKPNGWVAYDCGSIEMHANKFSYLYRLSGRGEFQMAAFCFSSKINGNMVQLIIERMYARCIRVNFN